MKHLILSAFQYLTDLQYAREQFDIFNHNVIFSIHCLMFFILHFVSHIWDSRSILSFDILLLDMIHGHYRYTFRYMINNIILPMDTFVLQVTHVLLSSLCHQKEYILIQFLMLHQG